MYGTAFGEDVLTITGTNLNAVSPTVTIDGIDCLVSSSTLTQITCTTGSRLTLPTKTSFTVKVGNGIAVIQKSFQYVLRWSDPRTWGTDLPPVDGDLVSVPLGMTLLVD